MKERHWEMVSKVVGFTIMPTDSTTLEDVINLNLLDFAEEFEQISESATKENNLEKAQVRMYADWAEQQFVVLPYK